MKKIFLGLLLLVVLFNTGCTKSDNTKGELEGIKYEETTDKTNYLKMDMNDGKTILIELYPEIAPITVKNFQKLVSEKFYDNLTIHRIAPGFVIQGGDPKGDGSGGSKETIKGEFRRNGFNNKLKHKKGVLSMARSQDMDSASSQFFICLSNITASSLDDNYAAFGEVIAGMDDVLKIAEAPLKENTDTPVNKPVIKSIRFVKVNK